MFSGIVQGIGEVINIQKNEDGAKIQIDISACTPPLNIKLGDSIAVNGTCLTATEFTSQHFSAEISHTTLELTNLKYLTSHSKVNIEAALTLSQAVNGHLVSGHVDATCILEASIKSGFSHTLTFSVPPKLSKYIIERGSLTLDGISLTVCDVFEHSCKVTVVPHTWEHTIAHQWRIGEEINLEIDMLARYIEKLSLKN